MQLRGLRALRPWEISLSVCMFFPPVLAHCKSSRAPPKASFFFLLLCFLPYVLNFLSSCEKRVDSFLNILVFFFFFIIPSLRISLCLKQSGDGIFIFFFSLFFSRRISNFCSCFSVSLWHLSPWLSYKKAVCLLFFTHHNSEFKRYWNFTVSFLSRKSLSDDSQGIFLKKYDHGLQDAP